jgi:ubiquinone/menaquinone biosynthesis C-methylase UbiE
MSGVDVSPNMVHVARSKGIPGSTFAVASVHGLTFSGASFTAAGAINAIGFTMKSKKGAFTVARVKL